MNKKILLSFSFLFIFIFAIGLVHADLIPSTSPCWVKGTVTGDGINVNGLTVGAYLGNTLLKSGTIASDGTYSLNSVGANDGNSISLKVYGASFDTFTFVGYCGTSNNPWVVKNFTVSKVANGTSCSNNAICSSGNCSNNVCAKVTTGGSDGNVTETTIKYTFTNPDVNESQIRTIFQDINLPDNEIQEYVNTAKQGLLHIERKLEIKKIVSSTGAVSYKSTFSIIIRNNSNDPLKDIKIVETIPKNIALNASEISSIHQFIVLKADPVLQFIIPSINLGETITIPYTVDKNITKAEFEGMSDIASKATVVETPANPSNNTDDNNASNNSGISSDTNQPVLPSDYVRPKGILSNTWRWIFIVLLIAFMFYLIYRHKHLTK